MGLTGARSVAASLCVTVLLATALAAQPDPDVEAAGRVVMQQLDAFRRGDFDAAFAFASATIHEQFDRGRFEQMVRGGYPEIARSVSAVIDGSKRGDTGQVYLFLSIHGDNGNVVEAVYELVNEQGAWRVNGVVTRPDTSERA